MTIQFSRRLAIVLGILTPIAETVRRWSTWQKDPASLFDDYILGAFLLYGAWRVGKSVYSGQRFLAAAWAFTCGMAYLSFFGHMARLRAGEVDPAPIASKWVLMIKGVGLGLSVLALVVSLRRISDEHG
ncbi:MAG TPA: hypothetical protein VM656_15430 [Pyrinomonadaceae bacterium]|nr:hypothetical protein [Pyrinomonadaceae bacterium]